MSPKHPCRSAQFHPGCGRFVVLLVALIAFLPWTVFADPVQHSLPISRGRNSLNETSSKIVDKTKDSGHIYTQEKRKEQLSMPVNESVRLFPLSRRGKAMPSTEQARQHEFENSVLDKRAIQPLEVMEPKKSASLIQTMRDQIDSAKAFLSFVRMNSNHRLLRDLRSQIRENEHVLRKSHFDADLPKSASEKIKALDRILAKARDQRSKCEVLVKRLRELLLINEEKIQILKDEGNFLGRLAARTLPKGLHCLALKLTIKYYSQPNKSTALADGLKLEDPRLYHYAIFSENVLAASVVVNSTVFHVKDPHKHVFHVLTDTLNYAAMKTWFLINTPRGTIVEVQNLEDFHSRFFSKLEKRDLHSALSKPSARYLEMHQKGLETFGEIDQLQLYLPDMFPNLDKILLLDDDIVVRTDLAGIWKENLNGKVSGAVMSCRTNNYHVDKVLNVSPEVILNKIDVNVWASQYCIHIFDLKEVKRRNVTELYKSLLLVNQTESVVETVPSGLIAVENNTHMLDSFWNVLHLDDISDPKQDEFQGAAAIHYGGYVKPWLEMNGKSYKAFWTRFVNYENPLLQECNINK